MAMEKKFTKDDKKLLMKLNTGINYKFFLNFFNFFLYSFSFDKSILDDFVLKLMANPIRS